MNLNKVALSLIVILSFFAIFCAFNIGMSWDEVQRHWQGGFRFHYLKALDFGNFNFTRGGWADLEPGLYDAIHFAIADFLVKIFPEGLIAVKHLINLTFSFLTLVGLFLISKKIFNKEIAYIATFLCFINPFFFGHMSMNPVDTIICFALIWFAYFTYLYCINFETKRLRYLIIASCFVGLGAGTRIPFLAISVPVAVSALIFIIVVNEGKLGANKIFHKIFFDLLIFLSITFFLMVLAWPYVHVHPDILLEALNPLSSVKYPHGPVQDILNGEFYEMVNTPRMYFFTFFAFRMPIFILILIVALMIILKKDSNFFSTKFNSFKNKIIIISSIIFFPVLLHMIFQVKIYNGIRLFLFIFPFLSLMLAVCFFYILKNFKRSIYIKSIFGVIIIFFFLFLQRFMYLTPYHYDYSNFFNINFSKTEKLYIHDYWTASYKELMELIKSNESLTNVKADFCGGHYFTLKYLANKYSGKKVTLVPYEQADYIIMIDTVTNDLKNKSSCFMLRQGVDVVSVDRLGVKLSVLRKLEK